MPSPDGIPPAHAPASPPPLVLDYGHARPRNWGDRVALAISALITGAIGLAIAVALIGWEILNWPSFAVVLAAVPIGCIAAAFLVVSVTAIKVAVYDSDRYDTGRPPRGRTVNSSPTE